MYQYYIEVFLSNDRLELLWMHRETLFDLFPKLHFHVHVIMEKNQDYNCKRLDILLKIGDLYPKSLSSGTTYRELMYTSFAQIVVDREIDINTYPDYGYDGSCMSRHYRAPTLVMLRRLAASCGYTMNDYEPIRYLLGSHYNIKLTLNSLKAILAK